MKRIIITAMFAVFAIGLAGGLVAQDYTPEQLEEMQKASSPGEHQKHLEMLVGEFTYTSKMWMSPDAPPMESKGESSNKMIMGGRYLEQTSAGTFMGQPFDGMGLTGYDNVGGHYVFSWVDNMGTGIITGEGSCSADKTWTLEGKTTNPMTGETGAYKTVTKIVDDDTHVWEWHQSMPDGSSFLMMEIKYKRKSS